MKWLCFLAFYMRFYKCEVYMTLEFYYFSYQCPLNDNMIQLLNDYSDKIDIALYDISDNSLLAKKMNIFSLRLLFLIRKKDTIVH